MKEKIIVTNDPISSTDPIIISRWVLIMAIQHTCVYVNRYIGKRKWSMWSSKYDSTYTHVIVWVFMTTLHTSSTKPICFKSHFLFLSYLFWGLLIILSTCWIAINLLMYKLKFENL
jgi:hypothetical protein